MATKKTKTIDPIAEAVKQIQAAAAPISNYDAGQLVDTGKKVFANQDLSELSDACKVLASTGSVNLLKPLLATATVSGITMTLADDGTYVLSGTSTAAGSKPSMFSLASLQPLVGQEVTLTGGYSNTIRLAVYESRTSSIVMYRDTGSGVTFTLTQDIIDTADVRIAFLSGAVATDVVIRPMIKAAALDDILSDTFYPYAPSNRELYTMIKALHPDSNLTKLEKGDVEE